MLACVRMSDSKQEQHMGKIMIEHVHVKTEKSFGEVAAEARFSDQSQFTHHFKRLVGVTPGRFGMRARTA
jgi:AraC-like DNA-binding protein